MKRFSLITVPGLCVFILVLMFSMELKGIRSSSPGNSPENPDKITDKKISLQLISPNGEEVLHPGEKFLITWESDPDRNGDMSECHQKNEKECFAAF